MQRTIEQPASLSGAALTEFKQWLGITRPDEDGQLLELLRASLEMCEAFTGQTPLEQVVEEHLPVTKGRHSLLSRPVQQLLSAETVAFVGTRTTIAGQGHGFELDRTGVALADLKWDLDGEYLAVKVRVGIAHEWTSVPKPLRQGIIRLASHYYRDRDDERGSQPPASVIALWRPWRLVRLA